MLLALKKWITQPLNGLRILYSIVLLFLLLEIEPLFIYTSFLVLILTPVIRLIPRLLTNMALIGLTVYLTIYFQFELHPESAISFFLILTAFKFTQVLEQRDFFFLVHCLFIVIGGGALFIRDIYYISFSIFSLTYLFFQFQVTDFKSIEGFKKESFFNIIKIILFASPLIVSLFIFFPRYRYFFPSLGSEKTGKIGYSQTLNNNSISSLRLNGVPALRVYTAQKVPLENLYWRGRVFSRTDGYNWKTDRVFTKTEEKIKETKNPFRATYQPLQNFHGDIIVRDWPTGVQGKGFKTSFNPAFQTFKTYFKNNKKQYEGVSASQASQKNVGDIYLQVPGMIKKFRESLPVPADKENLQNLLGTLKTWLTSEGFLYSLSPGKMESLDAFLENKKGYCTHFASLLALYLRLYDIPSRIVSGFQGGEYNEMGQYYLIRSNDAHAWVEAFADNQWVRVDPTSWIAPERILIGGQKFLAPYPFAESLRNLFGFDLSKTRFLSSYYDIQRTIDYFNSQLNLFFTNFNLEAQKLMAQKLSLNLKVFFSLVLVLPLFFIGLLFVVFNFRYRKLSELEKFESRFKKRLTKQGIAWQAHEGGFDLLTKVKNHPKESEIKTVLNLYLRMLYFPKSPEGSLPKLRKLLREI